MNWPPASTDFRGHCWFVRRFRRFAPIVWFIDWFIPKRIGENRRNLRIDELASTDRVKSQSHMARSFITIAITTIRPQIIAARISSRESEMAL